MEALTIRNILKGTKPGRMQTVGMMQVIPLISDIKFDDFISPAQAGTFYNQNYGSMTWKNDSDKTMIIPAHTTYLVKHAAQDHALCGSGLVRKKAERTYDTAACVQETQGGTIREGQHGFVILPFSLRESALIKRKEKEYGKLWGEIKSFNQRVGIRDGSGHLEYFFDHYDKELNEFVAEFESVPKQIGAIILVNSNVVGIERSPNHNYWLSVWNSIVRGCYGALAIEYEKRNLVSDEDIKKIRVPLNLLKINSVEDLTDELRNAEKLQEEKVKEIVRKLIDDKFEVEEDEKVEDLVRCNLNHDQFMGQMIMDSSAIVYASMITKNKYFKTKEWREAEEFKI